MTPEEIGTRLSSLLDAAGHAETAVSVSGGDAWARATIDVPPGGWRAAVIAGRDDPELAFDFFDWLSAVDEDVDGFRLVVHVWSTVNRHGALVRTRLADRANPSAPSIVDVYPGAAWHERETREMFGIVFTGPGDDRPLLLPPEFEGHPLRKDFVLAARVAKPWPGAKEPGESGHGPAKRQPMRPPGVPDPREWGPEAGTLPPGEDSARPARRAPAAARPVREPGAARPVREPGAARPVREPGAARPVREPGAARPERPARPERAAGAERPAGTGTPQPEAPPASQPPTAEPERPED
jgi:NADH-quinone oxidoreductase subunit C